MRHGWDRRTQRIGIAIKIPILMIFPFTLIHCSPAQTYPGKEREANEISVVSFTNGNEGEFSTTKIDNIQQRFSKSYSVLPGSHTFSLFYQIRESDCEWTSDFCTIHEREGACSGKFQSTAAENYRIRIASKNLKEPKIEVREEESDQLIASGECRQENSRSETRRRKYD